MITISSSEVLEALREPLAGIVSAVKQALEQTPPELSADVAELGIVLTGGGALLRDMDRLLSEETGLHVQVAEDPLTCVARGGGRSEEHTSVLQLLMRNSYAALRLKTIIDLPLIHLVSYPMRYGIGRLILVHFDPHQHAQLQLTLPAADET